MTKANFFSKMTITIFKPLGTDKLVVTGLFNKLIMIINKKTLTKGPSFLFIFLFWWVV